MAFSRTSVDRLQRLVISSFTVAFVLMLELSVFAFYQRNQASVQRRHARDTARIFSSKSLAAFALAEMETDPGLSLILVTESVRIRRRANGVVLPLSNECCITRQMIIKSRVRLTVNGHYDSVSSAVYSSSDDRL